MRTQTEITRAQAWVEEIGRPLLAALLGGILFSIASKTYMLGFFVKRQIAFSALPIYLLKIRSDLG